MSVSSSRERGRLLVMLGLASVVAGAILTRAAYIQVWGDPRLASLEKRQFQSKVLISPRRGVVTDRNGEPLVVNADTHSLAANPSRVANRRTLARLLSKALDLPASKIADRMHGKKEFVWIKRHLSENEMSRLKHWKIIDQDGDLAPGLWLVNESKRVYPHNELAAHVLGTVNLDGEGIEGVELKANERLKGKVISVNAIRDALGRPAFLDASAAKNSQDGATVQLTLDASLQFSAEQELKASVLRTGSRSGTVIVMNAVTGEILAMANEPSFNPADKGAPASRRRNRALTDGYEPGSTMKSVLLAGALQKGMKLTDTLYGDKGSFTVQGKRISEAEAHERFEWINLKKLIQVSSNVGAAKLALKIGADSYFNTLKSFEFGQKSGTDFPGEISGRMLPRPQWQPLALANIGFGQGILVTPIQMTRAYAAFFNGGWLVQPSLLKSTLDGDKAVQPKRILSEKAAADVVEALKSVTQKGGTGEKAVVEGYTIAGKTGTAQVVEPGTGRYSRNRYVASFIGSIVGVEQKVVIFAALDEPRGVYYASETAAPLFRGVAQAVANRMSMPGAPMPQAKNGLKDELQVSLAKARVLEASPSAPLRPEAVSPGRAAAAVDAVPVAATGPEPALSDDEATGTDPAASSSHDSAHLAGSELRSWRMPTLVGFSSREAVRALQGHRFQLEITGSGWVKAQNPEPGRMIRDGATVRLQLAD